MNENLRLSAPIDRWDEAVPLGNGLMGGLLWGRDGVLRLSLDRGDLWDERTTGEKEWWKAHPWDSVQDGGDPWNRFYEGVTPTKLPAGRLELDLDPACTIRDFELAFDTAEAVVRFAGGADARALFSAAEPVALIRLTRVPTRGVRLLPAGTADDAGKPDSGPDSGGAVAALGYPPARRGMTDDEQWYLQDAADGFGFCVCVATREDGEETLLAVSVTATTDGAAGEGLIALARTRCADALKHGYPEILAAHTAWWEDFWAQSSVSVPDPRIQLTHRLARYLYGAGSRHGAPPMPLQGVWSADDGGLPPWKGDYHNDLNTQVTYFAYQEAGAFESGRAYLDFLEDLAPVFRRFARDFYGTGGLASPGVMSLAGEPLGGWSQYAMSPTSSAWNAHLFYLHWRYTADDDYLRDHAYPWCTEVGQCMAELLAPDANGTLVLALSSSPEIFDNTPRAWLKPNSNYDLMCLKILFLALQEMADAQRLADDTRKWAGLAAGLGDVHAGPDGELLLDADTQLRESHRHLSHLIGVHPFNLITVDGDERDRQRIRATLNVWEDLGTGEWCGYTWSWMSCLRARIGDGEEAARHLDVYARAFVSRNGFHLNGDQSGKGYSDFTYRPFTLEGNFAAMQAVQEMLLQSWSPTPGERDAEVIRLFPAVPRHWYEASFQDLRAEGGHQVSAERKNGATTWFRVTAGRDGTVRVRDTFDGREPRWTTAEVERVGRDFEVRLHRGQTLEAFLPEAGR